MIPKVNRDEFSPDLLEDEAAYRARPEWFQFFYAAWLLSTASMDDKQRGWYIQLLTWAATDGDPPGYLPSDENELKQIAGMTPLPPEITFLLAAQIDIPSALLSSIMAERERKWQKVRRKFIACPEDEDYLYNPRLIKALRKAYRQSERAAELGHKGAESRWGKSSRTKEIIAPAMPPEENNIKNAMQGQVIGKKELMASRNALANAELITLSSLSTQEGSKALDRTSGKTSEEELVLSMIEPLEEVSGTKDGENTFFSGKRKRKSETFFDKSKWAVSTKMKAHLLMKYQSEGIEEGDVDYLAEKFSMVHAESKYSNWAMAFYNFVDNQLTKYGYTFGMYKRRGKKNANATREELTTQEGSTDAARRQPPWKQIESTPDRNARLEREADEYTRRLRGGGSGPNPQGETGLPLTADDLD